MQRTKGWPCSAGTNLGCAKEEEDGMEVGGCGEYASARARNAFPVAHGEVSGGEDRIYTDVPVLDSAGELESS
jgi:hypothetical protein